MPLRLSQVEEEDRPLWDRLFQLYLHDLSENTGLEPTDDGLFPSVPFQPDESRSRFVILLRNKPAGIVSFRSCPGQSSTRHQLDDFFILRCYRRLGIGEEVARLVFDQYIGHWQVGVPVSNESGRLFWRHVLRRYTLKHCRELGTSDGDGVVFEFVSPPPEPLSR